VKKLEIKIPNYQSAMVTTDNHLSGYQDFGDDEVEEDDFRIPLPDGQWRIYQELRNKIILMDYS